MLHHTWKGVAAAAIVILIMALLPPVVFGPHPQPSSDYKDLGDGWATIIYNYQTLITGLLAVAAAAITVWKMGQIDGAQAERQRQNEDVQAERHRQLIELGLRSELIKLERAINPQLHLIKAERIRLDAIDLSVAPYIGLPGDPQRRLLFAVCDQYWHYADGIRILLEAPQFVEAVPLFDGDLMHMLDILRRKLKDVLGPLGEHVIAVKEKELDIYYEERLEWFVDGLLRDMALLPIFISQFTDSFDRFRENKPFRETKPA